MQVRAMVQTGPRALELRTFPLPEIDEDSGLLRVEACGICGSDYEQYTGTLPVRYPVIPGHEPVGVIERLGARAAKRWGVREGDRVAVEVIIPCGHCWLCRSGRYSLCRGRNGGLYGYSYIPIDHPPGLWGGYAEYLYLHPDAIVHKISPDLPAHVAVLFNPLGAGFRWAVEVPHTGPGDTVLILGPGQRGLASVLAARAAGADRIIVTGLSRDRHKLDLALRLGADHVIDVEQEDAASKVFEYTGGRGADVVVEVTAFSTAPVAEALRYAAVGGRVVLAGVKGFKPVPDFVSDWVVAKELTLYGVLGVTSKAYRSAIRLIESRRAEVELLHTHSFPLEEAERALRVLGGEVPGASSICSCIVPGS
jgi:threonine dehydrogenase-like Zn-dependent dehydrogenase